VANSTLAKTRSQQASSAADTGHALVPGGYDTSLTVETNGTRGTQQTDKVHKPAHIKELVEEQHKGLLVRQEATGRSCQIIPAQGGEGSSTWSETKAYQQASAGSGP